MAATVPGSRGEAAARVLDVLAEAGPADDVCLIGSLARPGAADSFSDIDVRWTVQAPQAPDRLRSLRRTLQRVGRVESLRVDPDPRPDMRLVFVRFAAWPLWWRVDLEVHSPGAGAMAVPGADRWTPEESACMGVVVTLKALGRHRPDAAEGLFAAALRRIDADDVDLGDWRLRVGALLDLIEASSAATAGLVSRTRRLADEVLAG